jgi:hypothetical protein
VALAIGPGNYWMFGRYGKAKSQANEAPFTPEPPKLEGFDVELLTTPWPNQFDAPGGLRKSLGGYHAWQSRDAVNWVHHGPSTPSIGKWMTTEEFVDGKFYFYHDFPNDEDPHLYIDSDLTDGEPGENVGRVEARVGVDTDKDGTTNQWTEWQELKETYDHMPGFAKQISKTPAELDLSSLPEGFGFQMELKLTDTTESASKPILDKLTLTFEN